MKVLAFIPARGGSKRVPGKNIKLLAGKSLIAHTVDCARGSKYINRIIVSTDDPAIAAAARECGAETPFVRPSEISQDGSVEIDAFKHALAWLKDHEGYEPDMIVKLFVTSPFRKAATIDKAIELLKDHPDADAVRSVTLCSEHPYKMWTMDKEWLNPFVPFDGRPKESHTFSYQLLPKVYVQNASIDVVRPSTIWNKGSITGDKILALPMDELESMDVNTQNDFDFAEFLIAQGRIACAPKP